jgi:dephospho-CoA kinase
MSLKVGLTGGIGSGKSLVGKLFALLGVPVFESDSVSKKMLNNSEVIEVITKAFGAAILDAKGLIDRKKLAAVVFNDKKKLQKLNAIMHPMVQQAFEQWCRENNHAPCVIKEAAILFESGAHRQLDYVIGVQAPEQLRIARVMSRDRITADEVKHRISKQMPDNEKMALCDFIITNDDATAVLPQVISLHEKLISLSHKTL